MKKQLITFDQLAVLSFLRFGKLDGIDMTLIMRATSDMVNVDLRDDSDDYFIMSDGLIMLENNYVQKFNKNVDKELFEEISGSEIKKYLDNIDMYEFVLRKIKMLYPCCADNDELLQNFSLFQMRIMKMLYNERYIVNYLQDGFENDSNNFVKLTKRGELYLFLIDNKDEIDVFRNLLQQNNYDPILINVFLITQDLSLKSKEVLTLNNFVEFFNQYDVNPYVNDSCHSSYSRVKVPINK